MSAPARVGCKLMTASAVGTGSTDTKQQHWLLQAWLPLSCRRGTDMPVCIAGCVCRMNSEAERWLGTINPTIVNPTINPTHRGAGGEDVLAAAGLDVGVVHDVVGADAPLEQADVRCEPLVPPASRAHMWSSSGMVSGVNCTPAARCVGDVMAGQALCYMAIPRSKGGSTAMCLST